MSDTLLVGIVQGFNLVPNGCLVRQFQKSLHWSLATQAPVGSVPVIEMLPSLELFSQVGTV